MMTILQMNSATTLLTSFCEICYCFNAFLLRCFLKADSLQFSNAGEFFCFSAKFLDNSQASQDMICEIALSLPIDVVVTTVG